MHHATPDGIIRKLNWKPSRPSINNVMLKLDLKPESELPKEKYLDAQFPDSYDQADIGSCVDNGSVGLYERLLLLLKAQGVLKWMFRPSRLFAYYNARDIEGNASSDSGSTIADGFKALNDFGVCPEVEMDGTTPDWIWPYITTKYADKPPEQCYKDAVLHKAVKDHVVNLDRLTVLNALAADVPFEVGFTVHKSFMTQEMADTGIMHVPGSFDFMDNVVGGHGIDIIGYRLGVTMGNQGITDWALVRNSWGTGWGAANPTTGKRGSFWMPLDQVLCNSNVASDAHAMDLISESVETANKLIATKMVDHPATNDPLQ